MRQFHFFCKQRYLKYTVLSLLLCPLSSSAAEEWKDVKGESTTNIVESTQQKKQKRVITGVVRDSDTNEPNYWSFCLAKKQFGRCCDRYRR